jgi:hypothetical protein
VTAGLRIIVSGQTAQYPLGGVTWFYMHYVLGFARLGHDVWYVEDSGQWPYSPQTDGLIKDCDFNVAYLGGVMARFGLPEEELREVVETADLLIDVSGALARPWEYRAVRRIAYIDTDPVFAQLKLVRGQVDFRRQVDAHDVHFSYGELAGTKLPDTGHRWIATRAPVVLSEWSVDAPTRDVFTTVMNWTSHNPVEYAGVSYGQKDQEFRAYVDLPKRVAPTVLELALGSGRNEHPPRHLLEHKGWRLVNPAEVCPDLDAFRAYTQSSKAEWGVAKNGYVRGQSGWFSERSARYLAAGRPVVVQDTGFSHVLPVGEGILPFTTPDEAVAGIRAVEANYDRHSRAARAIAEEWFDSDKILSRLIEEALA